MPKATIRRVVGARLQAHSAGTWHGVPGLIDALADPDAAALITQTVTSGAPKGDLLRNLVETVRRLRADFLDRQIAACQVRLNRPDLAREELSDILRQQSEWRRLKGEPLPGPD